MLVTSGQHFFMLMGYLHELRAKKSGHITMSAKVHVGLFWRFLSEQAFWQIAPGR